MSTDQTTKRKRGRPRIGQELSTAVSLRLDQATLVRLRQVALKKGMGPTTLVRNWVLEYLSIEEHLSI